MSDVLTGGGWQTLHWLLLLAALWLAIGVVGLFALRRFDVVARVLFPLGGVVALVVALVAASAITAAPQSRSEEHTSELPSLMRLSYAVFCLKTKKTTQAPTQ